MGIDKAFTYQLLHTSSQNLCYQALQKRIIMEKYYACVYMITPYFYTCKQ